MPSSAFSRASFWIALLALLAVICIPLWMFGLLGGIAGPGTNRTPTQPAGAAGDHVVLYCSVDQNVAMPIVAAFEKQTGLKVQARYDDEAAKTVGLVNRIRAEAGRPVADVFWSGEIFHTIRLAREGLLAPHEAKMGDQPWPARLKDPQGLWHGMAMRGRVIAYDTRRVTKAQAPAKLEDLLDPVWKGRLVMARPAFGTTGGDVASWFAHYGPDRAREILAGLKANQVRLVSGNATAVRTLANSQADVCLTDTDDVYAAQRNGWPIEMNLLDQGGKGALTIPNTVARIKGGPNPHQATVLADFLLSPQTEEMIANTHSHNTPVHPEVAARFPQYAIPRPLDIDYQKVADFLPTAIEAGKTLE